MRVAIDLTALQRQVTGCDRYLLELVQALATIDLVTEYVVFMNRGDGNRWPRPLPPNFRMVALPFRARAARFAFQQVMLPLWLRRLNVQVLHAPSFFTPLAPTRARHLLTVHDLTFFTMPEVHSRFRRSRVFRAGLRASLRRADLVVVPSGAVAEQVRRLAPERAAGSVRVVPHGVASRFTPAPAGGPPPVLARSGVTHPYLLHVGTLEPRKNLEVLLEAFERVVASGIELDLVLAGKVGWSFGRLQQRLRSPGLAGRVHLLGHVADADLPALYAGARLFVCPSAYEGFGLPALEAMACGTPTLASAGGALAENLAGAAEIVEPSVPVLAAAIVRLVRDPERLRTLAAAGRARAAQFRWELTAQATRGCYEELAGC